MSRLWTETSSNTEPVDLSQYQNGHTSSVDLSQYQNGHMCNGCGVFGMHGITIQKEIHWFCKTCFPVGHEEIHAFRLAKGI